jgi:uncharacterized protein (TIGR00251 family)
VSGDLFDITADGDVVLRLHVQPGAGRTAVVGTHGDALKVKVAAPPTAGKANDAVVAFVAELFGVDKANVELTHGQSSRSKRVKVSGVDADDARRLLAAAQADTGNAGPVWSVRPPDH